MGTDRISLILQIPQTEFCITHANLGCSKSDFDIFKHYPSVPLFDIFPIRMARMTSSLVEKRRQNAERQKRYQQKHQNEEKFKAKRRKEREVSLFYYIFSKFNFNPNFNDLWPNIFIDGFQEPFFIHLALQSSKEEEGCIRG